MQDQKKNTDKKKVVKKVNKEQNFVGHMVGDSVSAITGKPQWVKIFLFALLFIVLGFALSTLIANYDKNFAIFNVEPNIQSIPIAQKPQDDEDKSAKESNNFDEEDELDEKTEEEINIFLESNEADLKITSQESEKKDKGFEYSDLKNFVNVLKIITDEYVDSQDRSDLLTYALKGMVGKLDPHSEYYTAEESKKVDEKISGEFGGLGFYIDEAKGSIKVVSPIEDTPAQKAGIKSGDLIIKVNDSWIRTIGFDKAVLMMRGAPGTDVTLEILRENVEGKKEALTKTLTRAIIKTQSVKTRIIEPGIGYIRITQFQSPTAEQLIKKINLLKKEAVGTYKRKDYSSKKKKPKKGQKKVPPVYQPLEGVIMDLRENPGGLLTAAVKISDFFLNAGDIVSIKDRREEKIFSAKPGDILDGLPIVVLIDEGSASAAEILTGALKDNNRALVVGHRSFGKGLVQTKIPLDNGDSVKITTARYYTPDGVSIQGEGITPDIVIPDLEIKRILRYDRIKEADLEGALKNKDLTKEDRKKLDEQHEIEEVRKENLDIMIKRDYMLYETLKLLKALLLKDKLKLNK